MGGDFAFLLPTMMFTVGGAFLMLWRQGVPSCLPWAAGFLGSALGFTAPLWPSAFARVPAGILDNALFAVAFFCYGRGLIGAADRGWVRYTRLAAMIAGIVLPAVSLMRGDVPGELLSNDLACATMLGIALVRMRPRRDDVARRVLQIVAGLVVLETVIRTSGAMLSEGRVPGSGGFMAEHYGFVMQATAGVLGLLFALSALATVLVDLTAVYRRDAVTDPLSGLLNRRGFADRTPRPGPDLGAQGAVIACDIDRFKRINDLYGHPAGDGVIAGFAGLIRDIVPDGAVAMRTGGEEFAIYLPDATGAEATRIANVLRVAFAQADWSALGMHDKLTASFGVALVEPGDPSVESAIQRADLALYDAKRAGRDRVLYRLQVVASNVSTEDGAARARA